MLYSSGKASLYVRLLSWICVCMRRRLLEPEVIERIRPWRIAGHYCWCDRQD